MFLCTHLTMCLALCAYVPVHGGSDGAHMCCVFLYSL